MSSKPTAGVAKRHALIAALYAELGDEEPGSFTVEKRLAWLRMMAMAFDRAYGIEAPIEVAIAGVPRVMMADAQRVEVPAAAPLTLPQFLPPSNDGVYAAARLGKPRVADQRYLVDLDGVAFGPRGQIDPADIPSGEYLWDFRAGEPDLAAVTWASGAVEQASLPALTVLRG
jgi:hypothetical protein